MAQFDGGASRFLGIGEIPPGLSGKVGEFVRDAAGCMSNSPGPPLMKIPSILVLLALATVSIASIPMNAQPAPAAAADATVVEVNSVKFNSVRWGPDSWLEAEVELSAKPGGRSVSGEYVERVRVTFNLGLDLGSEGGAKKRAFYRSSVEAVALEGGTRSVLRFYLPPEIVKRDRISSGDSGKHYVVEVEAGGKVMPPARGSVSSAIKSEESLRNFINLVASEGGQNEGVLVPQHLSPFAQDSQRRSPSVIRRDGLR